ncbi:MAG: hypothetical protein R3Y22_06890 [Bacteroidales bacterium]
MEELKRAIEKYIQDTIDHEWAEFSTHLTISEASKREIIFRQTDICKKVIYILEGIAASEYNNEDKLIISRFFQSGNLCSNLSSATSRSIERDNVIAITNIKYIEIPFDYFMNLYLYSSVLVYFLGEKY